MINGISLFWQKINKYKQFILLFCLCFFLVVGCNNNSTPSTNSENQATGNNLITIGTTLKARTLDPADSYELAGLNIIYNVGESLYTYQLGTTEIKPLLATELPDISPDGLVYTINVREGVKFHDGTAFNAAAMAFSLERFIKNGGKPAFLLADIVDKIETVGDFTLKISLKQPFAAFPALLAFPGTCAVSPQAYTIGAGEFNPNTLISTGPYKLKDLKSDSVSLTVFEDYWGEKPLNNGIKIQIYAGNSANLFNSFRTQAIDVAYQSLDPQQIKSLQQQAEQGKWQVIQAPGTAINYMVLNLKQKPLDQLEVRQAIAAVIDRSLIVKRVLQEQSEPVYSLIPTAFEEVYQPTFKEMYGNPLDGEQDNNIPKAKELLAKAGYSAENPAVIEIWYPSGSITRGIVAQTLKALVEQELGGMISFTPSSVESASFFSNLSQGIYPAALVDWYPDFLDPDNYIQPFLACNKGSATEGCLEGAAQSRGSFYYSKRANQLIEQERQAQNPSERQAIFQELQKILAEDVPYIPLWQTKEYAFTQKNIQGVNINPSQNFPFWTIAKDSLEST